MGFVEELFAQERAETNKNKFDDEFYIGELCELEKDFEDEFFIECDINEIDAFYAKRNEKVECIRMMGRIIDHMDTDEVTFNDPYAEGAAIMIKGISSYIDDHTDLPAYVKKSTRTVVEQEIFQDFAAKHYEDVDLKQFVFDGQPLKVVKNLCPHSVKRKKELEIKQVTEEKKTEVKVEEEPQPKQRKKLDEAYLNNLKAMKMVIPKRVEVPEPFQPYSRDRTATSRATSSRFSTSSIGSSSSFKPSSGTKYSTASKYSTYSKY